MNEIKKKIKKIEGVSEREKFSSRTLMSCQLNNFTSGREGGRGRERKRDRERESSNKAMPLL